VKPQDRTRAILLSKVESSLRIVLVVLSDAMTEERETCWLKVETIAERSGLCERQVRDLLADAEGRKLIRRWEGEHKSRDIAIEWDALAKAEAPASARGGARVKGAKTAPQPAKTAPETTGKDCHPDRQSLPPAPAKTAAVTGKDCPRSGKEAGTEAGKEAGSAGPADPVFVDGRPLPPDLPALLDGIDGGFGRLGRLAKKLIAANFPDTARLLALPAGRLRFQGHGLNDADERDIAVVLRERWRIAPGALAPPESRAGSRGRAEQPSFLELLSDPDDT
jgi:hypothetical protein